MKVEERLSFIFLVTCLGILTVFIVYKVITVSMDEGVYKPGKKRQPEVGGYVRYSRDNIEYQELDEADKMNFAFQIMKYNVQDKKELPEGAAEVKRIRKVEDLFKVQTPSVAIARFSSIIAFLSFGLFLFVCIAWLVSVVLGINPEKRDVLKTTILVLLGLFGLSYIIGWVQQRTMDKLDAIQSSL